jgi:UDP-N-acetylmuramate--alanine ligase
MAINSVFKDRHNRVHLVGIGGIGMSGIARVLIQSGFQVSGSDIAEGSEVINLRALGAQIYPGHHGDNVRDADVVVFSSAVAQDNPEIVAAKAANIPIIPRALMLAELMRLRCGIAIVGSHGKTTTTSLIGTLMHQAGLDPTVIIGGIVNHFGTNAVVGKGQFMVTEADESDGTFLHLSPTIAVVTNIDAEHLDFYQGGIKELCHKITGFLNALPFYGLAVLCSDDAHIQSILPHINRRIYTYGFNREAMYRAENITTDHFKTCFDLIIHGTMVGRISLAMVGHHNVLNTLAAIATLEEIGVRPEALIETLKNFNGVKRRFTPISKAEHFLVIDDYAHHPTEIRAVLLAARQAFADKKIRVLFQPHRFSRTKDLLDEFSTCFANCDSLVITDIYSAGENALPGITTQVLIDKIRSQGALHPHHVTTIDEGAEKVSDLTEKNDIVFTLGAGSITQAAPKITQLLHNKYGI